VKDKTPYVVVALQEAERANTLVGEMRRSLEELQLGLDGALNMSERMEQLSTGATLQCASIATAPVPLQAGVLACVEVGGAPDAVFGRGEV
jgi:predicted TIM-barrel enzyme